MKASLNVFGEPLASCSEQPMTGYFRDGCCNTDDTDLGLHVVCVRLTERFLAFSQQRGNDLITPRPEFGFPGLKAGDRWCLCATRWREALLAGVAPPVNLAATHQEALQVVSMDELKRRALDLV